MVNPAPTLKGASQRGYAKHRGISTPCVNKWYHKGKLVLFEDGSIDVEKSDAALAATRDPFTPGGNGGGGAKTRALREKSPDAAKFGPNPPRNAKENNEKLASLTRSREIDAEYSAKMKQLQYEQLAKTLVSLERVQRAAADIMGTLRRLPQRAADRLSARLAAESDPRKTHTMLSDELTEIVIEIAEVMDSLPEQITATSQ